MPNKEPGRAGDPWPDSLWRATAVDLADRPPLRGRAEAEVGIVGAGYTGLSAALSLAEAGAAAVVLDKAQPGWGCSGRNGGQVNPNWKVLPERIRRHYSDEAFRRVVRLVNGTCDRVFELIERYGIDCEAARPGYVMGGVGRREMHFMRTWVEQWRLVDADVHLLDRRSIAELLGTDRYDGGLLDRRGGSLQPLSYARGLARACADLGVAVHGNSPATSVRPTRSGWRITTPQGTLDCGALIWATNGYTDGCWPGLSRTIVPVASLLTSTRPLPRPIAESILPGRHAVSESAGVPCYYRIDSEDRMVFGGRGTMTGRTGGLDTRALRKKAVALFPQLREAQWEYDWGGYVAMTPHHRPMLLRLADNAFAGLGYNGRGVAMATTMGQQLALAARGLEPELPIDEPHQIPCHRFHPVGIAARILAGHVRDLLTRRAVPA